MNGICGRCGNVAQVQQLEGHSAGDVYLCGECAEEILS
jgi:predicted SprT family Zn-dependent metalloprotease